MEGIGAGRQTRPVVYARFVTTSCFRAKLPAHGRRITHVFSRPPAFARNFRNTTGGFFTFPLDFRFSRELPETNRRAADPAHTPAVLLAGFWRSRKGKGTTSENGGFAT